MPVSRRQLTLAGAARGAGVALARTLAAVWSEEGLQVGVAVALALEDALAVFGAVGVGG